MKKNIHHQVINYPFQVMLFIDLVSSVTVMSRLGHIYEIKSLGNKIILFIMKLVVIH